MGPRGAISTDAPSHDFQLPRFLDLVRFPSHFLWVLKVSHSFARTRISWKVIKPTTDALILLAKFARLPAPLSSHSTGFNSGSHWLNQIRLGR